MAFLRSSRAADEESSWSSKYRLFALGSYTKSGANQGPHLAYLIPSCTCKARITSNPTSSTARWPGLCPAERYTNHNPDLVLSGPWSDLISSLPYEELEPGDHHSRINVDVSGLFPTFAVAHRVATRDTSRRPLTRSVYYLLGSLRFPEKKNKRPLSKLHHLPAALRAPKFP